MLTFDEHNKPNLTSCYGANFYVAAVCLQHVFLTGTAVEDVVVTAEAEITQDLLSQVTPLFSHTVLIQVEIDSYIIFPSLSACKCGDLSGWLPGVPQVSVMEL